MHKPDLCISTGVGGYGGERFTFVLASCSGVILPRSHAITISSPPAHFLICYLAMRFLSLLSLDWSVQGTPYKIVEACSECMSCTGLPLLSYTFLDWSISYLLEGSTQYATTTHVEPMFTVCYFNMTHAMLKNIAQYLYGTAHLKNRTISHIAQVVLK